MDENLWVDVLIAALVLNAVLGFGYRLYRLSQGGPITDVIGQGLLGIMLGSLALFLAVGHAWPRWVALVYALAFGLVVMPIWVLGVLIPSSPRALDYAYTFVYVAGLVATALAALLI